MMDGVCLQIIKIVVAVSLYKKTYTVKINRSGV